MAAAVAVARQSEVGGSLGTARQRRQQRGSCGGGGSAKADVGGSAKVDVGSSAKADVGGSLAATRRWQQRDSATLAAAWRWCCGGGAQRDGGSAVAAARWLRR